MSALVRTSPVARTAIRHESTVRLARDVKGTRTHWPGIPISRWDARTGTKRSGIQSWSQLSSCIKRRHLCQVYFEYFFPPRPLNGE